jgi:Holliday junction resolvase RusA-like endonuclease
VKPPLAFIVPTMPPHRTAQQKGVMVRNGRPLFFKKAAQAREERNTVALVLDALPEGFQPFEGPLAVRLRMVWPYRRTERRRVVAAGAEVPHDVRPDLDNLAKGILDALTVARVWRDDGQIARLVLEKAWGPLAYWGVEVREMGGEVRASPSPAGAGAVQMAFALGEEVAG